jgi:hypothetical protein
MLPEVLKRRYVAIPGTSVYVPALEPFIAIGGYLPYDVVFVVGFNGVESPVEEVKYSRRPDGGAPVTATVIRSLRLEPLVKQAISENRTAFRRVSDTQVERVTPDERQRIYVPAMERSRGESRRRITDEDLKGVANVYLRALAELKNPTKAVQEEMKLPNRNTAKKWVQASRRAGFLSPALGERRGGAN